MSMQLHEVAFHHTALGLQFWDVATNQPVTGGLRVAVQLLNPARTERVGRRLVAQPNQSGIYACFGCYPDERTARDFDQLPPRRAVVDVTDRERRYLPTSFEVALPQRGPFHGAGDLFGQPLAVPLPPGSQARGVALFATAGRPVPAGLTALYAQVVVGNAPVPSPAPFAVVRVFVGAGDAAALHAIGVADERGLVTVPLPYPRIAEADDLAPQPALGQRTFALTVRIAYEPAQQRRLPGSDALDLAGVLAQGEREIARAWNRQTQALTLQPTLPAVLTFGEPVVLRTGLAGTNTFEGVLRIAS